MKKSAVKYIATILALVIIIFGFVFVYKKTNGPRQIIIQGEAEAHSVDVSSRVQGRVIVLNFDVGDKVEANKEMAILESKPLIAEQKTSQAQLAVAIASRNSVYSTRPETINARRAQLEEAQANLKLANQTYTRIAALSKNNAESKQAYDDSLAQYRVAQKAVDAAQANLDLAINGSSEEEKQLASVQVQQADAALNQVNTSVEELIVLSPISGTVTSRVAEQGQLYNPNAPLFSILSLDDMWFTFNIREDYLHGLKEGDILNVIIPALNSKQFPLRVTTLNVLGSFANWQATKATGDFDLRTFELRAKPINGPIEGLRAGMTAVFTVEH